MRSLVCLMLGVVVLGALQGCASLSRKPAVPHAQRDEAEVAGFAGIRYRVGVAQDIAELREEGLESGSRERARLKAVGHEGPLPSSAFLAISGGGDKGAFAAGLMNGWTAAGTRPEFKLVTGISTGALIAPFAFLGPAQDGALREFYTTTSKKDIMRMRGLMAILTSDAAADNRPLWTLVERQVDQALLDAIAIEYGKGRLLLVQTVDLDSRTAVIWNMTRIAASKNPDALRLFRSIMIASAAIPGAFPPVMIDVQVGDKHYQEMHVDGGTLAQVFVYPPGLHLADMSREANMDRQRLLYVIRNSRLDPDWAHIERRLLPIVNRAISSLIHSQGVGDLYRIHSLAQRDGLDFRLAYIPETFDVPHKEDFDTHYMQQLFQLGYDLAVKGYPWEEYPPGFGSAPAAP